jgi:HEAT repeat protein
MQELVKLGKPAVPYLIDSVTDDAGNVRMMIAWALDRIDAEESARTLLQRSAAAGRDRWRYIEAIRFMSNGSEHVKSDLEGLLSDSDLAVRVQAASALIQTSYKPISRSPVTGITTYSFEPSEAILPVLLEGLDSQRDEIKMWSAEGVYSLGKSRGAPAIPKLEQIVATEDPDSPLFRSAKLSLDMLKEGGAVP